MADRSRLAEVRQCLSPPDTGSSHLDRPAAHRRLAESRPPNKSSGRDRCTCDCKWGSASFVAAQIIGKAQISITAQNSRKDYRKGHARSSSNRLSATSAELGPGRITAAASATEHLDRLRRAPVERRRADRNPAASAKFRAGGILVPATRAGDCRSSVTGGGVALHPRPVEKSYCRSGRRTSRPPQNANGISYTSRPTSVVECPPCLLSRLPPRDGVN